MVFVSLGEGIDCTTPAEKLQLHILAALAEFERARITERVTAGLARAKRQGKRALERMEAAAETLLDADDSPHSPVRRRCRPGHAYWRRTGNTRKPPLNSVLAVAARFARLQPEVARPRPHVRTTTAGVPVFVERRRRE